MCAQCLTDSYGIKLQKMVSLSLLQLLTVKISTAAAFGLW